MIRNFVFKNNSIIKNVSLENLQKYLQDKKAVIWVDLQKPTDEEYQVLEKTFKFDKLSMEDCRKFIELPKVDFFGRYLFIVMHSISHNFDEKHPHKREIDFFLGSNFLVSVHSHESESVAHLFHKIQDNPKGTLKRADFFMYEIIDHFVDSYFPALNYWDDKIEELEADIVAHRNIDNTLKEIMHIKREILYLKNSIAPQRDVINRLSRRDFPFVCPQTSIYFRDVYDHVMRIYAELETQRDILNGDFEAYTSVLSNRLAIISNKMNAIMKRLTVIATIFMPLTFIVGVYGMNFHYMPELQWRYGYLVFWGIAIIIGVSMYWFFRKKHWA
jgi:magnesium transporter